MAYTQLRPLGFGEILDGAFTLYRRHFVAFFLTALIPFAPVVLIYARWMGTLVEADPEMAAENVGLAILLGIATAVAMTIVIGALTHLVAKAYAGEPVSIGDGFRNGFRRFFALIGAGIVGYVTALATIVIIAFAAALVIPIAEMAGGVVAVVVTLIIGIAASVLMVVAMSSLFAIIPAVVVEEKGPIGAVARSWQLARGGRMRILSVLGVTWLITMLPVFGIAFVTGFVAAFMDPESLATATTGELWVENLIASISGTVTFPFWVAAMVLLYYDRRIRAEGYDLEVAVESLAEAP
jgi:hypothetical protein